MLLAARGPRPRSSALDARGGRASPAAPVVARWWPRIACHSSSHAGGHAVSCSLPRVGPRRDLSPPVATCRHLSPEATLARCATATGDRCRRQRRYRRYRLGAGASGRPQRRLAEHRRSRRDARRQERRLATGKHPATLQPRSLVAGRAEAADDECPKRRWRRPAAMTAEAGLMSGADRRDGDDRRGGDDQRDDRRPRPPRWGWPAATTGSHDRWPRAVATIGGDDRWRRPAETIGGDGRRGGGTAEPGEGDAAGSSVTRAGRCRCRDRAAPGHSGAHADAS